MFSERMTGVKKSGIREIFDIAQTLPSYINLGIGEPDFKTPSFIERSAKKAIDDGFSKYTSNIGIPELREAISRKLKKENSIDVDPSNEIIVTAGATQSIFVLMHVLLNAGDEVMLPTPLFTAYKYCAKLAGAKPIEISFDEKTGYSLDAKKLEKHLSKRTRLLVLNSPCNPTGAVFSKEDIEQACEFAVNNDLFVISDEIYERFLYDGAVHFSPASRSEFKDKVITINGFSKTYAMTGWRIGYTVASAEVIRVMTLFNMYNAVCAASFVQVAAADALNHAQTFFNPILRRYAARRKLLCEGLEEIGFEFVRPLGAFYVFTTLPNGIRNSLEFCKDLLVKRRVSTVPGSTFGDSGEGHFRISYSVDENQIEAALERMKAYVSSGDK
ncbi:MAG: pyridoxal phosphate-dependent aminotransferase [Nitrososphaerales archaeon]